MEINKRELLRKAFDNEEVDRVPIGFWHHYVLGEDQFIGLEDKSVLEKVVDGHLEYYKKTNPDMMKLMNEGFMGYPPIMGNKLETAEDLLKIKSIGPKHPWITEQIKHVKRLVDLFGDEVMTFYNVFAPLQVIRIRLEFLDLDFERFVFLAENFQEEFHQAGLEIQKDLNILVEKLLTETNLDGIYYCVQNVQSEKYTLDVYNKYIRPTEMEVLNIANKYSDYNILHVCGYAHHKNDLTFYKDYESKAYNWATFTEGVTLEEGKKIFGGKSVLGGFDNNPGTLIDKGTEEELDTFVKKLIDENGYKGFVIGADCSIPNDIDDKQVKYISDASHKYVKGDE